MPEALNITLVVERPDLTRGGREVYTVRLAEALARRGHAVTVLCQSTSWQAPEGISLVKLGRRGLGRARRMLNFVSDVQAYVGQHHCHVVHAMLPVPGANVYHPHGGPIPAAIAGSLRRHRAPTRPIASLLKQLNACRRQSAELERRIVEDPQTLCVCVSQLVARQFRRYYGRSDRAPVVFNGVDVPDPAGHERAHDRQRLRFSLGVSCDDPVFLVVATNFALKGVSETILAFSRWYHGSGRQTNPHLLVVGRELTEGYQRFAGLRDVGNRVHFLPPTERIFQMYAAADALVLLTWYDPCSLTVLEAARWGIPSLTTRFNGAAEAFTEGGCLVVDSPRDRRLIIAALDELADPQHRRPHAERCLALADTLSLERHVDRLLEVYAKAPPVR